jgi:outer membrane protein W
MFNRSLIFLLFISLTQFIGFAQSESSENNFLKGRSGIDLHIGLYDNTGTTKISVSPEVVTTNASTGFMGAISYQYWFQDYLSFGISLGALVINANTSTQGTEVSTETATVAPLIIGINYYPLQAHQQSSVLPYLSGYIGPYIGVYSRNEIETIVVESETIVETAFGARLGAGLDFLIGDIFKLGIGVDYHFITDFSRPIGGTTNYSGPSYSLTFGFVFN